MFIQVNHGIYFFNQLLNVCLLACMNSLKENVSTSLMLRKMKPVMQMLEAETWSWLSRMIMRFNWCALKRMTLKLLKVFSGIFELRIHMMSLCVGSSLGDVS